MSCSLSSDGYTFPPTTAWASMDESWGCGETGVGGSTSMGVFHMFGYFIIVPVLLTDKGEIHKVVQKETETFVIAEYQPFHHRHHVLRFLLHPPTVSNKKQSGSGYRESQQG